ncbi:hypothetical protein AQUCO_02800129v1, partial [Aquilegia coerulea]
MAEALVSIVVEKLGGLLLQKITFLRGVRGKFEGLQNELKNIIGFLKAADSMHNQDPHIRVWVADVRDIAYDVEDIIDAFLLKEGEGSTSNNVLKRYAHMPKKLLNFDNFGKEIDDIFAKIKEISDRRKRYKITSDVQKEGTISSPATTMLLRRIYPHTKDDDVVGLVDQTNTLVAELLKEDDRLCVVSIYGMGGLGNSTLTKNVYNHPDVKSHFDCYAWTSISQKLNTVDVLQEILRKVGSLTSKDMAEMKEVELLEKLYAILQRNRSKIMLTTRHMEVAKHADQWSFHLEPRSLTYEEAWELLCRKAFPQDVNGSSSSLPCDFEECGRDIVKKCGGFPLQVIVLGGILASKGTLDEWEVVSKQIGTHTSHGQDGVFSILSLSYKELPYNLKPLFLYLGIFPEDSHISVKKLVRMWMAESLIREEKEGETIEEVGTRYLDELIHRCMVQIGREENFFEVINENLDSSSSSKLARSSKKLRRCAISIGEDRQCIFPKHLTPCLRTVIFNVDRVLLVGPIIRYKDFKFLKVLELIGSLPVEEELEGVLRKLSNLRYLSILGVHGFSCTFYWSFHTFENLVCLQTLEVRSSYFSPRMCDLMSNVMHQLRHWYGHEIRLSEINNMTKLQTLCGVPAGPWITDLVKLTELEKLSIFRLDEELLILLKIAIGGSGLDKLRSLYLQGGANGEEFSFSSDLLEALCRKRYLQKLKLHGKIYKLPSQLPSNLIQLNLICTHLSEDPMPTLKKLQHLLFLELRVSHEGKEMVCSAQGFPQLQHLQIKYLDQLEEWTVEEGAMP